MVRYEIYHSLQGVLAPSQGCCLGFLPSSSDQQLVSLPLPVRFPKKLLLKILDSRLVVV